MVDPPVRVFRFARAVRTIAWITILSIGWGFGLASIGHRCDAFGAIADGMSVDPADRAARTASAFLSEVEHDTDCVACSLTRVLDTSAITPAGEFARFERIELAALPDSLHPETPASLAAAARAPPVL
jgi:hypothetical protein